VRSASSPVVVLLGGLALVLALLVPGQAAHAASLTVTTTQDELAADGNCSLREAIQAANTDSAVDGCAAGSGADVITLPAGTYTLAIPGPDEDANATGDLDVSGSLTIAGAGTGATVIDGAQLDRVLDVAAGASVTLRGLTIRDGLPYAFGGGGIRNGGTLALDHVTVTDNQTAGNPSAGGGILNTGSLSLVDSVVSSNHAFGGYSPGGGIDNEQGTLTLERSTVSGNTTGGSFTFGAGIATGGGTLTVERSAVSGNVAGAGGGISSQGGAIVAFSDSTLSGNKASGGGGFISSSGAVATFTNATISGNEATAVDGGGLDAAGNSVITVISSTVSGNSAFGGGGITKSRDPGSGVKLKNSILAYNSGGDCGDYFTSLGHNLASDGTCNLGGAGDLNGVDPLLGPLADNGGPTLTQALLAGSPAIDAGSDDCPPPATDQRGVVRPQGGKCDIGAYERAGFSFTGFYQPVDNPGPGPSFVFNVVKAGAGIPVKFSLGGDKGLSIFAAGFPTSQQIVCDSSATLDGIEQTVTAGGSSLSYDPVTGQYAYVWKSDKAWANGCRRLTVRLSDGSDHFAYFKFTK
jgi:CSLREA domain-containing protein